ncbi:carbohydrate ABC transporter permease, partial [Paenibacillus sepulcri]|nr:carbohydrate ABC transporter permease [Paenibacillus sepulcri]
MMMLSKRFKWSLYHVFTAGGAILLLYPVLWLVMSSFKQSERIFITAGSLIPSPWIWTNFREGWVGVGGYTFATFTQNSLIIVILSTIGAVLSSALVAFGF